MIEKICSYTFQEVLALYPATCPVRPHDKNISATFFTDTIAAADLLLNTPQGLDSTLVTLVPSLVNALMLNVYNRHADDYFFLKFGCYNEDLSLIQSDYAKAMNKVLNVIDNTIDKYIPMLKLVKDNSSSLIKPVESVSDGNVKFNDTPQNDSETGFDEDDYTSTHSINHQVTKVDVGTLMERLKQVFDNFHSVMLSWSNEFNYLFFKEEQL